MPDRPEDIVQADQSEVERGELSGPANSLTPELIDCGCSKYQLPSLVKFATRRVFLVILCCIGIVQSTTQTYLYVTSSTLARKYEIDPYAMEWILCTPEIALVFVGLLIAYTGDRFHRASWLGGLAIIQCVSFLVLLMPHFTSPWDPQEFIDRSSGNENLTNHMTNIHKDIHLSIYPEASPDLCLPDSSFTKRKLQWTCFAIIILILVQLVNAIANVAYYSFGLSYLDDNTKKTHVPVYLSIVVAVKLIGSVAGYIIGWLFLRMDANNLATVSSYTNQIGAWWLGWPIFTILLLVPALMMSIFPRKLPSLMVQETAANILDQSGTLRGSQRIAIKKVGSTEFLPSMLRLLSNKILNCNVLSAAFFIAAIINLSAKENVILESKFHAPRPSGSYMGFGDPLTSRITMTILKPILIGACIILNGFVIARFKPKAKLLVTYNLIILVVTALIVFGLAFNDCDKQSIIDIKQGPPSLLRICNRDCSCTPDADFRPVCDSEGSLTFYSPCHAGCEGVSNNDDGVRVYHGCSCVQKETGNSEAREGPCGSGYCQAGWIVYEVFTTLIFAAGGTVVIGDLLINLRSVNVQDKALTIGYAMTFIGLLTYIPTKFIYDLFEKVTCQHWGYNKNVCRLHDSSLGYYVCFFTAGLIIISALLKVLTWFLVEDLQIYDSDDLEEHPATEMRDMAASQLKPLLKPQTGEAEEEHLDDNVDSVPGPSSAEDPTMQGNVENRTSDSVTQGESSATLKYGPVGPGDRRGSFNPDPGFSAHRDFIDDDLDSSDESQVKGNIPEAQVPYELLKLDSDFEHEFSDLNRSPTLVHPELRKLCFPDPDNYEDPRVTRNSLSSGTNFVTYESSVTNNSEINDNCSMQSLTSRGDFNEIGIPLIPPYESTTSRNKDSRPNIMMAHLQHMNRNPSRELLSETSYLYKATLKADYNDAEENMNYQSVTMIQPMDMESFDTERSSSRDQASPDYDDVEENRSYRSVQAIQPVGIESTDSDRPPSRDHSSSDYNDAKENRNYLSAKMVQPTDMESADAGRPSSRDQGSSGFGSLQDVREKPKINGDRYDSCESFTSKCSEFVPPSKYGPLCTNL